LGEEMSDKPEKKNKKPVKKEWVEPEDKVKWLLDIIEAGEAVVKAYERYLLNKIDHIELAKVMTILHDLLPMSIDDDYDYE
tara:strand:+ start:241 stop:483 length:243 start_codon:yes stop_codon:yes gene_type:complete